MRPTGDRAPQPRVRSDDMRVALRQLIRSELEALLQQGNTFALACYVHPDALPPPFVVRRAVAMISAGEPELWWSPFLIVQEPEGTVVGGCAFKGSPREGRAEVLYGLSKQCRGRGVASAAVAELVAVAFARGAVEVLAEIEPHNVASIRVVERCGFERLGQRIADDGVVVEQWLLRSKLTPNLSIERTDPGGPEAAAHVER
jgi:[ribosomal protein S5]-alanine N-acetyltransferase